MLPPELMEKLEKEIEKVYWMAEASEAENFHVKMRELVAEAYFLGYLKAKREVREAVEKELNAENHFGKNKMAIKAFNNVLNLPELK